MSASLRVHLFTGELAQWDPCDWLCGSYFVISLIKSRVCVVVKAVSIGKQGLLGHRETSVLFGKIRRLYLVSVMAQEVKISKLTQFIKDASNYAELCAAYLPSSSLPRDQLCIAVFVCVSSVI